jgi:hypothetical protein
MAQQLDQTTIVVVRWFARIVGALMVALFVVFFVGESLGGAGSSSIGRLTPIEWLEVAALLVMSAGVLLAWRWEVAGGALSLGGGLAFNVVESLGGGQVEPVWFAVVFVVVGVMFLVCGYSSAALLRRQA